MITVSEYGSLNLLPKIVQGKGKTIKLYGNRIKRFIKKYWGIKLHLKNVYALVLSSFKTLTGYFGRPIPN